MPRITTIFLHDIGINPGLFFEGFWSTFFPWKNPWDLLFAYLPKNWSHSAHQSDRNVGKKYRSFSWIRVGYWFLLSPKKHARNWPSDLPSWSILVDVSIPQSPPPVDKDRIFHRGQDVFLIDFFFGGWHSVEVDLFHFVFYIGLPVQISSTDTPLEMCRSSTPPEN